MSHFDFPRDEWAWFAEKFGSNIPTYTSKSPLRVMIQIHQVPPLDFGAPVHFLDKPMWEQLLGARPREATLSPRQWVTCQWNPPSSSIFQRSFQNLQIFSEHPGVYHSNLGFAWLGCNLSFHPILGCLGIQVALREGAASFRGLNFVFFVPTWPSPASSSLVLDGEEYVALTELNLW